MGRFYRAAAKHPTATMRVMVYAHHGPAAEVLVMDEQHARPVPAPGHVLVRVCASGLNPLDVKFRKFPVSRFVVPLPKIPGIDLSGVVEAVPPESRFQVGDRVFAMGPVLGTPWGSCAELCSIPEVLLSQAPVSVPLWQAAALPLVALTVIQGLRPAIRALGGEESLSGRKILIHAGSGGVGSMAIQYCKSLHMYVATTCSAAKAEAVRQLGADETIDYHTERFEDRCRDYDIVLDPLPFEYEARSAAVLRRGGHYVQVASSDIRLQPGDAGTDALGIGVPETRVSNLLGLAWKRLRSLVTGPSFHFVFVEPDDHGDLALVAQLVDRQAIRPVIDRTFPLAEAAAAHDYLEEGHAAGKVVLIVNPALQ